MAPRGKLIRLWAVMFLIAPAFAAHAQQLVVVLPFAAADEDLAIYRRPVADAVAKVLRDGYHVTVQVASGEPPKSDWVIELRATRDKDKKLVRLEAWLHDTDASERRPAVAAERSALAELDKAAVNLGHRVGMRLLGALDARRAKTRRTAPAPVPPAPTPAPPPADSRPTVILYRASGEGVAETPALAAAAATELLTTLGYRVVASERRGLLPVELAAGDATIGAARAAIMIDVSHLVFTWDGVLTAKGTVRLVAVSPQTRILYNRDLVTDTVVGGRGDVHATLVRHVLRQAMDIARRELAAALSGQ